MNTFEQAIGAGATITFPGGRQFLLLSTSSEVDVRFFNPKNNPSEYAKGLQAGFKATFAERFLKVEITSAAAQTVKVGISDIADCEYNRSAGDVNASIVPGSNLVSSFDFTISAGGTSTVISSNASRKRLIVSALVSNTSVLRIAGGSIASNRGVPLHPGETLSLEMNAGVNAHNPGSTACSVALTEELL